MTTQTKQAPEARRMEEIVLRPAVDVIERESGYDIVADLPGVDQQHVELSVEDRVLTIEGRTAPEQPAAGTLLHRELDAVCYRRTFELSEDIDTERISATVKDGVLRLALPKVAQRVPRKIAVQAG